MLNAQNVIISHELAVSYVQPTWKIASDERGEVADEANDQSKAKVAAARY